MPEYPYKLPSQTPRGKALACRFVCWAHMPEGTIVDLPGYDDALSPPQKLGLYGRVEYPDGRQATYELPNVIRHMADKRTGRVRWADSPRRPLAY